MLLLKYGRLRKRWKECVLPTHVCELVCNVVANVLSSSSAFDQSCNMFFFLLINISKIHNDISEFVFLDREVFFFSVEITSKHQILKFRIFYQGFVNLLVFVVVGNLHMFMGAWLALRVLPNTIQYLCKFALSYYTMHVKITKFLFFCFKFPILASKKLPQTLHNVVSMGAQIGRWMDKHLWLLLCTWAGHQKEGKTKIYFQAGFLTPNISVSKILTSVSHCPIATLY